MRRWVGAIAPIASTQNRCSKDIKMTSEGSKSFTQRKKDLRMWYKRLKGGMSTWEQVPEYYKPLLKRYYPHLFDD